MQITRWFSCFLLLNLVVGIGTTPWVHAKEIDTYRSHLEYLAAFGAIKTPYTTQPINTQSLIGELDKCSDHTNYPAHVRDKCLYVQQKLKRNHPLTPSLILVSDNQQALFNNLTNSAYSTHRQVGLNVPLENKYLSGSLQLARALNSQDDANYRLDGSHVSLFVGNWQLGVGAIDRWWGPGWHSSLILSYNARPTPGLYLSRNQSDAPQSQWFKWIGPWHLTTFMNQLESERAVPDALLWGMRISLRPTWINQFGAFELGLSRTAMWAGEGRPSSLSVFGDLLLGNDNFYTDQTGKSTEPGNQLAGFDFVYSKPLKLFQSKQWSSSFSFYGQVIGEDEAGGLPSRPMALFGASLNSAISNTQWTLFIEASDTALDVFKSDQIFNSAYGHNIYQNGYRYKGRSIGSQYDNDTRGVAVGSHIEMNRHTSQMVISQLHLNRDAVTTSFNSVSASALKAKTVEFTHQYQFSYYIIGVTAFYISQLPDNVLNVDLQSRVALTLQLYF